MKVLHKKKANHYLITEQDQSGSEVKFWQVEAGSDEQARALIQQGKASLVGFFTHSAKTIYRQDYKA